jgi:hypothetical protein
VQKALKDEDEQRRGACPTGFWSGAMMGNAINRRRRAPNRGNAERVVEDTEEEEQLRLPPRPPPASTAGRSETEQTADRASATATALDDTLPERIGNCTTRSPTSKEEM